MPEAQPPLIAVGAPAQPRGSLRRVLRRALLWIIIIGAAAGGAYWVWLAPAVVTVHTVQRGELVAEVLGTGTLEAHIGATISPKISGLVTAVRVDQGDHVEAGQELVRLDDSDLSRQVEVAESTLGAADAAVERQKADRARALAVLDQARYDYERVENLVQQNTASATEFEEATKTLRVAEADVARADAALVEAQKQVIAAEKTLEYQKAKLSDTVVRAPCAGLIVRRDRDPGDVVVPGSSMLFLVSTDELWISAWVDETEMSGLKPGQPGRVVFRAEPGRPYAGEVARLGREVDRETREFLVDVRVRELPENWAVGQRAEVYIEAGRQADAVLLPTRFIVWRDGQAGTFVEEHGRAAWRALRLGLRGRETVAVTEGLSVGDRVLAAEAQGASLKPGQRVAVAPGGDRGSAGKQP
jgi:HlyD family secretion protein